MDSLVVSRILKEILGFLRDFLVGFVVFKDFCDFLGKFWGFWWISAILGFLTDSLVIFKDFSGF